MSTEMRLHASVAALTLFTAGCVLLVASPPEGIGGECRFTGEITSACGRCVTEKCDETLNSCCGDSSCADTMALLDQCAGGAAGCSSLLDSDVAASTPGGSLATCISKKCGTLCTDDAVSAGDPADGGRSDGKKHLTRCTQADDHCYCSIPSSSSSYDSPNATTCGTATYPNSICCADERWPLSGTSCDCSQVTCATTVSGCECSTSTGGSLSSCGAAGNYSHCCLNSTGTVCKCGSATACPSYETEVDSCASDLVRCGSSSVSVAACALYDDPDQ